MQPAPRRGIATLLLLTCATWMTAVAADHQRGDVVYVSVALQWFERDPSPTGIWSGTRTDTAPARRIEACEPLTVRGDGKVRVKELDNRSLAVVNDSGLLVALGGDWTTRVHPTKAGCESMVKEAPGARAVAVYRATVFLGLRLRLLEARPMNGDAVKP